MKITSCIAPAVLALLAASTALAIPIGTVSLHSEAGDPIGAGADYLFTDANGSFSYDLIDTDGSGGVDRLQLLFFGVDGDALSLLFSLSSLGADLVAGIYGDAMRGDFAELGHPGLDASLNAMGCDSVNGGFTVQDAQFSGSGIVHFGASFEQHCDGAQAALRGTISISDLSPPVHDVPEPGALPLFGIGVLGLLAARRKTLRCATVAGRQTAQLPTSFCSAARFAITLR